MAGRQQGHRRVGTLGIALASAMVATSLAGGVAAGAYEPVPDLGGEIRVVHAWAGAEGEAFQAVVDGFTTAQPGVTVTLVQVPFDELNSQMIQQFAAGTPPDVVSTLPGG